MDDMKKILAVTLAVIMTVTSFNVSAQADDGGKYVSDVYFAYGKTEEEAVQWLQDNGWEPISGSNDFNAGKNSSFDDPLAVAMGIKRTNDVNEAITDMAVMNMKGGYSFPDYEALLNEKKAEIDEYVNNFFPVINEYRANFNGEGSAFGKQRADLAYTILNQFYDGEEDEKYAKNDTRLPLGELLLQPTRQEGNEAGGDLQQIILEGNSSVVFLMEQMLALAADNGQETWITRLSELSGDGLTENFEKYVPEAAGQNVSASVAMQYLNERFGDTANILMEQWIDLHADMAWFYGYNDGNGLWKQEGEEDSAYKERVDAFFNDLSQNDPAAYDEVYDRYANMEIIYNLLFTIPYAGEWGDTLGDFFYPTENADYAGDPANFLPFAAALSQGQRVAATMVSFRNLLIIGAGDEQGLELVKPDIDNMFGSSESKSLYFGIDRGIFRGGVALTSAAEMEPNMGRGQAYELLYNNLGVMAIASYSVAAASVISMIAGGAMMAKDSAIRAAAIKTAADKLAAAEKDVMDANVYYANGSFPGDGDGTVIAQKYKDALAESDKASHHTSGIGYAGRTLVAIGAVLLIGAAVYNGYRFYSYYQKTFTPIPLMIVDEADIVSFTQDAEGNDIKNTDFNQYAYYKAAGCNRQAVGNIGDWQDGVDQYAAWGCGDAADLNGDFGQEWLALYTVKNTAKGAPILADSLTLQYGSADLPEKCTQKLHFFTMTSAVDLGDMAYSYNNDKNGVYFFWDSDKNAETGQMASAFTGGHMAMAGAGGLVLGLLVATLIFLTKRKKKEVQTV